MDGTATSLFATGVYGVAKTVACAAFLLFVADSLGRRWSLLWTSAAQAIVLFIIGTYGRVRPPVAGQPVRRRHRQTAGPTVELTRRGAPSGDGVWLRRHCLHLSVGGVRGTTLDRVVAAAHERNRAFQFGWGPACWILVSEIPTARLRAMNVALAAAVQWLFNFVMARSEWRTAAASTSADVGRAAVLTMQSTMGKAGYVRDPPCARAGVC